MKYLTKENILLAMVAVLFLVQVNDMRKDRGRSQSPRGAIMERMRGMDRGDWGARMEGMRKAKKGKAEEVSISPGITCCDHKLPCCDQDLACCDTKS